MNIAREIVLAEVAALRTIKSRVVQFSAFGEDNHTAIDAQVDVLENELSEDAAIAKYEREPYSCDAARNAIQWAAGNEPDVPSEGWPMIR